MPTKVYTHHRNYYCIMPFVGIILYEALKINLNYLYLSSSYRFLTNKITC